MICTISVSIPLLKLLTRTMKPGARQLYTNISQNTTFNTFSTQKSLIKPHLSMPPMFLCWKNPANFSYSPSIATNKSFLLNIRNSKVTKWTNWKIKTLKDIKSNWTPSNKTLEKLSNRWDSVYTPFSKSSTNKIVYWMMPLNTETEKYNSFLSLTLTYPSIQSFQVFFRNIQRNQVTFHDVLQIV